MSQHNLNSFDHSLRSALRPVTLVAALSAAVLLGACSSMTPAQNRVAVAAGSAAAGAALGEKAGGRSGAAIGAAIGAGAAAAATDNQR